MLLNKLKEIFRLSRFYKSRKVPCYVVAWDAKNMNIGY